MTVFRTSGVLVLAGLAIMLIACGAEHEYYHEDLGWTMQIPPGWKIVDGSKVDEFNEKGRKFVGRVYDGPVDETEAEALIYLQRGPAAIFGSLSQTHVESRDGLYTDVQQAVFELNELTYKGAGIRARHAREQETIDGVTFERIKTVMLSPNGDKQLVQVLPYQALLGSQSLTVTITTGQGADSSGILAAWRASTFDRSKWASG